MNASTRNRMAANVAAASMTAQLVLCAVPAPAAAGTICRPLEVYGIQGTGQSSPDASPTTDTGFLSQVFRPALAAADGTVGRVYVPYQASFGGATEGGDTPYSVSVQDAGHTAETMMAHEKEVCPSTRFGLVGYSQGAHAVRGVMDDILDGKTAIRPDEVALVANFGDPGRPPGAALFPGRPGQVTPSAVPGTADQFVSHLVTSVVMPSGGGIGPEGDVDHPIGALAGRYASFCTPGDLACDAPQSAPLLHVITNLAGQMVFDRNDPIKSAETIAQALALTTIKTLAPIMDPSVDSAVYTGQDLAHHPAVSLSQRLAIASDPRTPLPSYIPAPLAGLLKIGTIGTTAAISSTPSASAPDPAAALASAGASSPAQLAAVPTGKVHLVPPVTQDHSVISAFDSMRNDVTQTVDLARSVSAIKYWDVAKDHGSYGQVAATPTGKPPTKFVADWIAAAGKDIALSQSGAAAPTAPAPPDGTVQLLGVPSIPGLDLPETVNGLLHSTGPARAVPTGGDGDLGKLGALTGIVPGLGGDSGGLLPGASAADASTAPTASSVNVPGLGNVAPFLVGGEG